jgi:hypothetical protein
MTPEPQKPTLRQARVEEILSRIKMAQFTLYTVLGLFSLVLIVFLISLFVLPNDTVAKTVLGATDVTLGASLRAIVGYLFPKPK